MGVADTLHDVQLDASLTHDCISAAEAIIRDVKERVPQRN